MKLVLNNIILPTDLFLMYFLKANLKTLDEYESEFYDVIPFTTLLKSRTLHGIDTYPYVYILHLFKNSDEERYRIFIRHLYITIKSFIPDAIPDTFPEEYSYDIAYVIKVFFVDVNIIYFILFIQYYLL